MNVTAGAATDRGRIRARNEDAFLVQPPLYAVADGMGGHVAGDVASSLACDTLAAMIRRRGPERLGEAMVEANRAVLERQLRDPTLSGMGTTLTAAVTLGERLLIGHVGDSRAYLLRDGDLRLLTDDHTWVHEMVRSGELTEAQARTHPNRSMLTRALGLDPQVDVDQTSEVLRSGDRVLLCSDGLTALVPDSEIERLLNEVRDPQEAAERLVETANAAGGVDNTTVVVLDVDGSTEDTGRHVGAHEGVDTR